MATIERLITTSQLQTNLLKELAKERKHQGFIDYDKDLDLLMVMVVHPDKEIVVHYIDGEDHVALLYQADTFEVVGLQIEDFETGFIPKYAAVENIWRLSDRIKFNNLWDLTLEIKQIQPRMVREIARVSIPIIGEPAERLERVFA